MQITLNVPDEFPQEIVNKILNQFERQVQIEKNLIKTTRLDVSKSDDIMITEQSGKLIALRSALIEGENSGILKNYSLQSLLAELDSENLE